MAVSERTTIFSSGVRNARDASRLLNSVAVQFSFPFRVIVCFPFIIFTRLRMITDLPHQQVRKSRTAAHLHTLQCDLNRRAEKIAVYRVRTHGYKRESCAERIAPIGTLSQNGYGTYLHALICTATSSTASDLQRNRGYLLVAT